MSTTQLNAQLAPSTSTSSFKAWMQAHPLAAYFTIAFAGTWLMDLPMVLGKEGLGLFPYSVPMVLYIILFILGSFTGPTFAAILVTNAVDGKEGLRKFFHRYGQWRVGLPWYLVVIFGFPILYVVSASVSLQGVPLAEISANWVTFFSSYLPALLIFPAFITWGEEPGWRGFALTRLEERYHPLVASLVVGFMHGLWHLPIYLLVVGPVATGPFDLIKFSTNVVAIMAITIIWAWVFNNAKGSILFAVLLHASLNAAQSWMGTLIPNYPQAAGEVAFGFYIVAALALILITKGRLGYPSNTKDQMAE
jgi:membrane protease YdiL (CAAX protease family)